MSLVYPYLLLYQIVDTVLAPQQQLLYNCYKAVTPQTLLLYLMLHEQRRQQDEIPSWPLPSLFYQHCWSVTKPVYIVVYFRLLLLGSFVSFLLIWSFINGEDANSFAESFKSCCRSKNAYYFCMLVLMSFALEMLPLWLFSLLYIVSTLSNGQDWIVGPLLSTESSTRLQRSPRVSARGSKGRRVSCPSLESGQA